MSNGRRFVVAIISVLLCAVALYGCTEAVSDPAPEPPQSDFTLILVADGQIRVATSEDADSIADVLEKAGITLRDGDMLSVKPNQVLSSGMVVEVLRCATVQIALSTESLDTTYSVSLVGATVGDALRAVGISPSDVLSSNFEIDAPLVDGMEIEVSSSSAPAVEMKETADSKETAAPQSSSGGGSSGRGSGGGGGGSAPAPSGPTVVSTERYDDCDGSGHGVMVITYSDGTQVERPY